mgnify:CR=1 FL=1
MIHHSGHTATERPRGSSAIQANTDYLYGVYRDEKEMLATLGLFTALMAEIERHAVHVITEYAKYQRLRGWAETTIRRRTVTLSMLERLAAPGDLTTITGDEVAEFLAGYRSPRTRHSYRSDIRAFYTWACRRGLVLTNPTEFIKTHAPENPVAPEGENLWAGTRGYYSPEAMTAAWVREKRYFKAGVFPDNSTTGRVEDVGHYTQLAWRDTGEVGCAMATSPREDILVCRYSDAGNYRGERPF